MMTEELLNAVELAWTSFSVKAIYQEDDPYAAVGTELIKIQIREIFRLARVGLKEEERLLGL